MPAAILVTYINRELIIMWLLQDLFKLMFAGPRAAWLFGNVRAVDAAAVILLPALLGAVIGGGVVWYISRRRRAAAILDAIANDFYSRYLLDLTDGELYVDGVKGRYVSVDGDQVGPSIDLPYTVKEARKALDRAGYYGYSMD